MESQLSEQQKQALDDSLQRADAFEGMIKSKGWEYVKAYYANKLQAFTNGLFTTDKEITLFDAERKKIAGLRELIGFIESDLDALRRYREQQSKSKSG